MTLLIPGFNDSEEELRGLTEFIAGVSPDIPWHVTAFHEDYKMNDPEDTAAERPAARGRDRQASRPALYLRRQSAWQGRRPGRDSMPWLRRNAYPTARLFHRRLSHNSRRPMPVLRSRFPGRWAPKFEGQITSRPFSPRQLAFGYNPQLSFNFPT